MRRVRRNLPDYRRAVLIVADSGKVQDFLGEAECLWRALASLHYRESGFLRSYNAFQLDKGASGEEERQLIREHFSGIAALYGRPDGGPNDFPSACLVAADFLIRVSARKPLMADGRPSRTAIADAILRYNAGRKTKKDWREHAYCASDPKRGVRLKVRGTVVHKGVRKRVEFVDSRPGAVVIYDELTARDSELREVVT